MNFELLIYKSLNESFDFELIDLDSQDIRNNPLTHEVLAGDNVKIPIDTLIAGVYNVDCPKKLSRKYTKIGEYFAYRSPDVLPGRVLTRINPGSNVPWYSTDYAYECVARGYSLYTQTYGCVRMLSDNMRRALINNGFTHLYSYGKDINNTPADIPESLDPCINTILSTALQRSVNFREHMFFVGNEPQSFFYDFFISPDNGLIIVDHVSEYKEGLTSNFTTGRTEEHLFKLASAPVRFMSTAIVFTNKIAYKMSNTVGELKSKEKQYKLVQYIKKFTRAVEDATGLYVLSLIERLDNTTYDRTGIMLDKHKHLYYSMGNPSTMKTNSCPRSGGFNWHTWKVEPTPAEVQPCDLSRFKDIKAVTTMAGLAKEFHKVVAHPKIIGFQHERYNQLIIYAVADPEFVRPLLGDAAVDFLREKCKMYYRPSAKDKFMRFYTFTWYTDSGMELFDRAYKENMSMAAIKRAMG